MGVVDIGRHCLEALLESGAEVVGIFTADKQNMVSKSKMHPDYFGEFDDLASRYKVPLHKLSDTSQALDIEELQRLQPDIIFCIGWPQVIPRGVLRIPRYGCIGIHPTLLPERRGGAPVNWCLIDGVTRSGVTLFYFDEGIDSGDIIAQSEFEIAFEDTAKTVLNKITTIATRLIKEYYPALEKKNAPRIPQDHSRATYTRRRRPEDGIIEWNRTSLSIYNWVRALSLPFPGAFTYWNGSKLIVWDAELLRGYRPRFNARPGEILDVLDQRGLVVATADSCLLIKTVETEKEHSSIPAYEFAREFRISTKAVLGV